MSGRKFGILLLVFFQVFVFTLVSFTSAFPQRKLSAGSQRTLSPETVYSNATPITINTMPSPLPPPNTAVPYPSQITVSGMTGTVTRVAVVLKGLDHLASADLDFLLVGPGGEKFIFLSDTVRGGGSQAMNDEFYTIADDAPFTFPTPPGQEDLHFYKPTSGDGSADVFPAPAPAGPYNQPLSATFASVYNGINPNGTWSLYVVDDTNTTGTLSASSGKLNTGWALTITTSGSPATFANNATVAIEDVVAASTPYGSSINVSGTTGVISNLKVTLTGLSHARPRDLDIVLASPDGRSVVIMSDAGGTSPASNINLTFDGAALNFLSNTGIASGTFLPTDITNATDTWLVPAPFGPKFAFSNNALNNFNGDNPNGDWNLYIVDATLGGSGTLAGGWSLDITTSPAPPPPPPTCESPGFSVAPYSAGTNPTNLAIADYNNDTKPDVAVVNQISNNVSILLGNGDGTFGAQSTVSVGSSPYSIVAGKFNADSNFDLAVTNSGANTVLILLGNGNGTFAAGATVPVGSSPISITSADFNSDTKADLAVANFGGFFTGSVSLLMGNGSGGFTSGGQLRTRTQPAYVAAGDLNNNTIPDLVVASFGSDSVSTFIGNGLGGFTLGQNLTSGIFGPVSVAIGDITNDGNTDIMIANYNADTVTRCLYDGVGFYSCTPVIFGAQNPISVVVEDFTGDGFKEPAVALSGSNSVRVVNSSATVGLNPNAIVSADLNNDSKPDLISANSGSNDISVILTRCAAAKGNIFDFSGDKRTDYTVWRPASANWYDYTLSQGNSVQTLGYPTDKLVPADYNGDGITDFGIYRPENGLWVTRRIDALPIHHLNFGLAEDIPVPADFDGDRKVDIAVWRPSDGNWYIRRSSDHSLMQVHWGTSGDKPVPADFDGDNKADLTVFRPSDGVWYTLRSTDTGFQAIQFGANGDRPVVGDYDGDGKADPAVFRPAEGTWYYYRSSDGGFNGVPWGLATDIPVPGDYEGDGRNDFAVWRSSDFTFYVLKSSDQTPIYITWGKPTDTPVASAYVP
jgi:subtilisin-like proprotein convertase family protein